MPKFFYACSECDRTLEDGEDFCPDHPNAQVLTVVDSSVLTGRKGGSAKTPAKAKASARNGKLGGRPKDSAAWRRAKRAGYQINKTDDGSWRWSKNFGEYSDGHALRADAIEEAVAHHENNSDE